MTSQQRGSRSGRRGEQDNGVGSQVDHVREGFNHEEGQPEHIRRDMLRLRGRQALLDLLVRIERERQQELQGFVEYRAVSDFAHRNRIQSLTYEFKLEVYSCQDNKACSLGCIGLSHH
ncbi:UNVERIFIED_CONTAM: hypothetical protein Sangu_3040800 [Sesamum angustifolium]|uniref:Uncharacterized protein n=1 Tax=Sesamum angustifolium TaxID=2727405 RepID=A0AAW2KFR9_9LAMI